MDGFGGTWWTHRYPGARSDSDLYTYAFGFRPWQGRSIATAEEIHSYLGEVIKEYGLDSKIRYGHRVQTVNWSNEHKRWTVEVSRGDTGERFSMTTDFLWLGRGTTTIVRVSPRSGTGLIATRERSFIRSTGRKIWTMPESG
ncbi:L-lysine 6-monooxygenase family protein [Burkholderia cepacia]|nr:L-lysine 6-monooxygenase family protein [Burkholderia cepacia]